MNSPTDDSATGHGTNTGNLGDGSVMPPSQSSHVPPLYVPNLAAPVEDTKPLRTIIRQFLNPSKGFFSESGEMVKLTIVYAIGKLGLEHFEYMDADANARILRPDSAIRQHGLEEGMPSVVMEWLLSEPIAEEMVFSAKVFEGKKDE